MKTSHLYSKIATRWKSDFQLSVVSLLGVFVILAISPFAVYRYLNGDMAVFLMEIGIIVFSISIVSYAWLSGNVSIASAVMAVSITAGIIFTAKPSGIAAFYWYFTAIMFNFTLVKPKYAVALIVGGLLIILIYNDIFTHLSEKMIFIVSVLSTTIFAYIFAHRNQQQKQQLILLSKIDPLTEAYNRRAYSEELKVALSNHNRSRKPYVILLFDVDYFKKINDTYGHEKGDEALISLVNIIRQNTRESDRLFRVGGEEFSLLLENVGNGKGLEIAQKIRVIIEKNTIIKEQKITVSVGVSELNEKDDIKSWEKRADDALYKAKVSGRNCCVCEKALINKENTMI